jgi:hypothetical protein
MELKNGKVYFSSASDWNSLLKWLKKKGKRPTNEPWEYYRRNENEVCLVQSIEEIPKNPPKPKFYSCDQLVEFNTHKL